MRIGINVEHEPDPLVAILTAGGISATPGNLSLLRASLEALGNQQREHRPAPGVRQVARSTEAFLALATLYKSLGGSHVPGAAGGPFYQFCQACAVMLGIKIPKPETFKKSFSGETLRKR